MSKGTMRRKVETRLATACAGSGSFNVPLEFENVRFEAPNTHYVSLHILDGRSHQAEIVRNSVVRHPGVLQLDVMAPEDETSKYLDQLSLFVGKLFERQSFILDDGARLVFRTMSEQYIGKMDGFCRNVVSIPYYRDEAPSLPGE